MINLILIPKIDAQAATYPATTSFTYTYDGYDYQFYFSGEVDSPQDYRFDESVCNYVIQKSSEGLNLSLSAGLGAKIDWFYETVIDSVFDFYRNYLIAGFKTIADWVVWTSIYGFSFEFTGLDSNYPGYETYGDAYGWRFEGWAGEKIDLVLDSQGMLYGSNPIGNYTFSEDQRDFGQWSIHQHDGNDIWIPSVDSSVFIGSPYFIGDTLYFYLSVDGISRRYHVDNFSNSCVFVFFPVVGGNILYRPNIQFINSNVKSGTFPILDDNNEDVSNGNSGNTYFSYNNTIFYGNRSSLSFGTSLVDAVLPCMSVSGTVPTDIGTYIGNMIGLDDSYPITQSCTPIFLYKLNTLPLPEPIVLPVDDPVPVTDIQPDPVDFTPNPDDEPDPVPGIDYPVPGPTPVPVPPLPPLVSGNDDLWPDVNGLIEAESGLDSYLGVLGSFEFTPLQSLVEGFIAGLTWVSMVMMTLYNGSDFSILFVVLSMFFIAACLLGVYKWWTH